MSFLELANKRYSVRSFADREVEKEKILQVLEAARISPSAVNYQPRHYIVITEKEQREKIIEAYPRKWFTGAPVIIAACGDHSVSWKRKDGKDHCDIDVAIAVDHMTLAAADIGLGTCWICAFDSKIAHEALNLPENYEVVALLALGYPEEEEVRELKRKSMEEIVSWETFQG